MPGKQAVDEYVSKIREINEEMEKNARDVALIFVDLVNSTDLKEQIGNNRGVVQVICFNSIITDIILKKGEEYKQEKEIEDCAICKYNGDEVIAYLIGNNSAKVALEMAKQIQIQIAGINESESSDIYKYQPKIGVDFGKVYFATYHEDLLKLLDPLDPHFATALLDPHGLTVDRTARIVNLAQPFQILVSDFLLNQLDEKTKEFYSDFDGNKELKLKGIREKVIIHEIPWDEKKKKIGIEDKSIPLQENKNPQRVFNECDGRIERALNRITTTNLTRLHLLVCGVGLLILYGIGLGGFFRIIYDHGLSFTDFFYTLATLLVETVVYIIFAFVLTKVHTTISYDYFWTNMYEIIKHDSKQGEEYHIDTQR